MNHNLDYPLRPKAAPWIEKNVQKSQEILLGHLRDARDILDQAIKRVEAGHLDVSLRRQRVVELMSLASSAATRGLALSNNHNGVPSLLRYLAGEVDLDGKDGS